MNGGVRRMKREKVLDMFSRKLGADNFAAFCVLLSGILCAKLETVYAMEDAFANILKNVRRSYMWRQLCV